MIRPCSIILSAMLAASAFPQVRVSPRTPLHPNPGRVLKLVEVMRIRSDADAGISVGARRLETDASGHLFMCDSWSTSQRSHLTKFSADGRFIKDLCVQGEGPGEIQSVFDFVLSGADLFLYDYMKRKIVVMDTEGKFITELKKATSGLDDLIGTFRDWLVFLRSDVPTERKTSRLYDQRHTVILVSRDGQEEKELATITNQMFYISSAQGGGGMNWDPFVAEIGGDRLFVTSTQEYLIEAFDLDSGKKVTAFRRKYPRIKHETRDWEMKFIQRYDAPKKKYENDIAGLLSNRGHLWVVTSTKDQAKGALYDVFDVEGRFVDSFFVDIKGQIIRLDGDFLFVSGSDEADLPVLVKYRIAEPVGAQ